MRRVPPFILFFSFILGCGEKSDDPLIREEVIHREQHLGEYMKILPNGHILSVSRDTERSPGRGLVSIDPKSFEMEVLDENASEARDLHSSGSVIAYRLKNQIRYIQNGERYQIPDLGISKLRDFQFHSAHLHFIIEDLSEASRHICLDEEGNPLVQKPQTGRILHRMEATRQNTSYILQTNEGLELLTLSPCPELERVKRKLILPGVEAKYVDTLRRDKTFFIAYLDERDGCLRLAHFSSDGKELDLLLIDGRPQESYVGLDLQIFSVGNEMGILYLDGWKLKPKLARTKNSEWEVFSISSPHAGGFYPVILEKTDKRIRAAWHIFRTATKGAEVSFEDLIFVDLDLQL